VGRIFAAMLVCGLIGSLVGGTAASGLIGAAVGLLIGLCIEYAVNNAQVQRDLTVLNDVLEQAKDAPSALVQTMLKVKETVALSPIHFNQTYEHHLLHDRVTDITDKIKDRPDLQKPWTVFLNQMKEERAIYLDGVEVALDFTREIDRLNGRETPVEVENFDPRTSSAEDLEMLAQLDAECFGRQAGWTAEAMKQLLDGGVIARDTNTKEILGFIHYKVEKDGILISGVGRKASAAKLKIGDKLFRKLLEGEIGKKRMILQVRESNEPARALYKKFGFVETGIAPNYYGYPRENACNMARAGTP
jgi:ribosomal-protein-alanine N-acetyltransferase